MRRNLRTGLALGALAMAGLPSSAQAGVNVCNEAENSHRGGYVVTGGPVDPVPPAFLRGSQMRVGNGHGAGLVNAAERSPALRTCGPPAPPPPPPPPPPTDDGGDGTGGGDTGGGEGPPPPGGGGTT